jgi:hypothetical protein
MRTKLPTPAIKFKSGFASPILPKAHVSNKLILVPGLVKVCSLFILQAGQRGRCMPSNANGAFDEQLFDTFSLDICSFKPCVARLAEAVDSNSFAREISGCRR